MLNKKTYCKFITATHETKANTHCRKLQIWKQAPTVVFKKRQIDMLRLLTIDFTQYSNYHPFLKINVYFSASNYYSNLGVYSISCLFNIKDCYGDSFYSNFKSLINLIPHKTTTQIHSCFFLKIALNWYRFGYNELSGYGKETTLDIFNLGLGVQELITVCEIEWGYFLCSFCFSFKKKIVLIMCHVFICCA
jgi:hypothetical protein